ncbi:MAG: cell division protein [Firmicutes bacterium]|nr:cell division protein [Bacillota bacterium]
MQQPLTYALDVGTRTIAGIVIEPLDDGYRILAAKIAEQEPGAMQDGQIHDIHRVAKTIGRITDELQQELGRVPKQAAVAAAGRTLKTMVGSASLSVSPLEPIDEQTVQALEMQAVAAARADLNSESQDISVTSRGNWASADIFVGYSPISYYLDNEPITSLTGHRGTMIGVDVIVTFLPRVVIDSLSASLAAAGLDVGSLTLEPIAAIKAAIPPSMRRLRLALVDVGAGTSDIALTKGGTVIAYGMVSIAGDEITEALCQHYLLDFSQGEQLKRQFQRNERLSVTNVLGQRIMPPPREVSQVMMPAVKTLAEAISQECLRLGGSAPQAVICIGGGSLTPYFPETLAQCLKLPKDLVAVRDREAIASVKGCEKTLSGPDCITPIAIAIHGTTSTSVFLPVTVNGRSVRVLGTSTPTVREALLASGVGIRELRGKPGAALTITINGEVKVIPGSLGKPAVVRMNGQVVNLDAAIQGKADLTIEPAEPGADAAPLLQDIVPLPSLTISFLDRMITVPPKILRNGVSAAPTDRAADRDVIEVLPRRRLKDIVEWLQEQGEMPRCQEASISVTVNQQPVTLARKAAWHYTRQGQPAHPEDVVRDGDVITVTAAASPEQPSFILSDVFSAVELQRPNAQAGGTLKILLNGKAAGFTTPIADGDAIEISWARPEKKLP